MANMTSVNAVDLVPIKNGDRPSQTLTQKSMDASMDDSVDAVDLDPTEFEELFAQQRISSTLLGDDDDDGDVILDRKLRSKNGIDHGESAGGGGYSAVGYSDLDSVPVRSSKGSNSSSTNNQAKHYFSSQSHQSTTISPNLPIRGEDWPPLSKHNEVHEKSIITKHDGDNNPNSFSSRGSDSDSLRGNLEEADDNEEEVGKSNREETVVGQSNVIPKWNAQDSVYGMVVVPTENEDLIAQLEISSRTLNAAAATENAAGDADTMCEKEVSQSSGIKNKERTTRDIGYAAAVAALKSSPHVRFAGGDRGGKSRKNSFLRDR